MQPLPELTAENRAFWTGGADGQLMIAFCQDCSAAVHPPQLVCPQCLTETIAFRPAPGTGTIYSFTVNHQPWLPGMKVPFILVVVDIDGAAGVRVSGELVDCAPDAVRIGQRVAIGFTQLDDIWQPHWSLIA